MKSNRILQYIIACLSLLAVIVTAGCGPATDQKLGIQYYSPLKDAIFVSTGATVAVRYGPLLTEKNISGLRFEITGSQSGVHSGHTILADDQKTVIFKPDSKFTPGETVKVALNSLRMSWLTAYPSLSYSFTVAQNQKPGGVGATPAPPPDNKPNSAFPNFLTVPQDIPHFTVNIASPNNPDGYIFVSPFYWTRSTIGSYLLILNTQGKLVYYQDESDALSAFDFKPLSNGLLSYFDQKRAAFLSWIAIMRW